jgi:hypothetical protein
MYDNFFELLKREQISQADTVGELQIIRSELVKSSRKLRSIPEHFWSRHLLSNLCYDIECRIQQKKGETA